MDVRMTGANEEVSTVKCRASKIKNKDTSVDERMKG